MSVREGAFQEPGAAEEEPAGRQQHACGFQEGAGAQCREAAHLLRRRVVVRRRASRQRVDEQPVRGRPAAPAAQAEPAGGVGQVHEGVTVPRIAAGQAPQIVEHPAVAQQADPEAFSGRLHVQAVQVAAGLPDLGENVRRIVGPGHDGEARELEPPVPETGLAQPAAGLQRDDQHALALGPDGLQQRPGERRRRADAGQRDPVPRHLVEPGGEDAGAGDRAEQHAVVTPAVRLPPLHRRADVVRVPEQPRRPLAQQRAAVGPEGVRDRLLAEFLLHHVDDDARGLARAALQVAREPRDPLRAGVERDRIEPFRAAPAMHGQPGVRDEEHAPRRHHGPPPAVGARRGPGTPCRHGPPRRCAAGRVLGTKDVRRDAIRGRPRRRGRRWDRARRR